MEANFIKKYIKKSVPDLIKVAVRYCHKYIRERDQDKMCVSCGEYRPLSAGHFYSAGHYPSLRFNDKNIHGQCSECNTHLHANLICYRRKITERISQDDLERLDLIADQYKLGGFKWDRMALIETIWKYKELLKK